MEESLSVIADTLFLQLKQAFDPLCLLNCNKVVRVALPEPGEVKEW